MTTAGHCLSASNAKEMIPLTPGDIVYKRELKPTQDSIAVKQASSAIYINPTPLIVTGSGGFANTVHVKEQGNGRHHKYVAAHVLVHSAQLSRVNKNNTSIPLETKAKRVETLFRKMQSSQDPTVKRIALAAEPVSREIAELTSTLKKDKTNRSATKLLQLEQKFDKLVDQITT